MLQISESVQQTTEIVALMPTALSMTVTSHVPVYLDLPEMDTPAQVNHYHHHHHHLLILLFLLLPLLRAAQY